MKGDGQKSSKARNTIHFSAPIEKDLKNLSKTDDWHGILGVVEDYLIIALCIFIASQYFFFYPIAILVIAARQRGLASLLHEAAHGHLAKSRFLNRLLGTYFSGYLIFQGLSAYRQSHVKAHHGSLGHPQKDPDYAFLIQSGLYGSEKPKHFAYHLIRTLCFFNIPSYLVFLCKNRGSSFWRYPKEGAQLFIFWFVILGICYFSGFFLYFFLFWIVPLFVIFPILGWLIELSEHYPLLQKPSRSALYKTRNRMSHWIEAPFFSIHQENFHLVHHLYPKIPYWNYKKAHQLMMQDAAYQQWNHQQGGIFFSNQSRPGLIWALLQHKVENQRNFPSGVA